MRALVSVYDKTGLVQFVRRLLAVGCEVVSSGGTAAELEAAGLPVTRVSDVTGAPEILGGRVKTLHPKIHGGILARGERDDAELADNGIDPFDLVICNLYPFRETVADALTSEMDVIEKIDIGGPAMMRAAAKNHHHVAVVVDPAQYDEVANAVEGGQLDDALRRRLAAEAFFHTAAYDAAVVEWLGQDRVLPLRHVSDLRYGENPQQRASLYREEGAQPWWAGATQLQGKAMSFNNYADAEAAWRLVVDLGHDAAVIVKHTNPCGAALGDSVFDSFTKAWECDPLSAFGGVIALNGTLDRATAEVIAERYVEVVLAREVEESAAKVLAGKESLRVISAVPPGEGDSDMRRLEGGLLIQERDYQGEEAWQTVSEREPTDAEMQGLQFAWVVCAHTKSNAVVIANAGRAVGVGAGDQSRVGAAERAAARADGRGFGGVAASDAFFPFRDGLDTLVEAGVTAVVEPGGSRNDQEVIDAANEASLALVFTGERHFKH